MDARWGQTEFDRLRTAVGDAVAAALIVAERDPAWETPAADSPAGRELAAEEARQPAPGTGSWPWLGAARTARWALWVMVEEAQALPVLVNPDVTSYAADAVCRAVLEAGSLAWWLLDPDIDSARRTARFLLYRLDSAEETRKAVGALELAPDEDPSEYGETVDSVLQEIGDLGWSVPETKSGRKNLRKLIFDEQEEHWRGYTERAADLVAQIWPEGGLPYRLLSAVVHAGLSGLMRNLATSPDDGSVLRPAPDGAAIWLWQDAYLVAGALVLTADRAVRFLGLHEHAARSEALIGSLQHVLIALRPAVA
jgi:hypothetical protein